MKYQVEIKGSHYIDIEADSPGEAIEQVNDIICGDDPRTEEVYQEMKDEMQYFTGPSVTVIRD